MSSQTQRQKTLDEIWEGHFTQATKYREPDGTIYVPRYGPKGNFKLSQWCARQRHKHRIGRLAPKRAERLEKARFPWDVTDRPAGRMFAPKFEARWEKRFQELLAFKKLHGHCRVNGGMKAEHHLNKWILRQRQLRRKGKLRADRQERLAAAGIVWGGTYADDVWERSFMELVKFKKKYGHTRVKHTMPGLLRLARWCKVQRNSKRTGEITPQRRARLDTISFYWGEAVFRGTKGPEAYRRTWEQRIADLTAFKARFGHCMVPTLWPENVALTQWINSQRTRAKRGLMKPARRAQLDALGFVWSVSEERRRLKRVAPDFLKEAKEALRLTRSEQH